MVPIDAALLRKVMAVTLTDAKAAEYAPHLVAAMTEFGITGARQAAAFIAQLAHESHELTAFREYGGEKARYAPYYGRGAIQLTWRRNYLACGKALGVDLVAEPDLLVLPEYAFRAAGWFWKTNHCGIAAERGDFERVTRIINGGLNHYPQRLRYYKLACAALGIAP